MKTDKQKAHSLLDSMIHNCALKAKNYRGIVEISYSELAKEIGFSEIKSPGNLRITIKAEFLDEEQALYEAETGFSLKSKARN